MTGRDIIKFIICNNLLDKQCVSNFSNNTVLKFIDYLSNDEEMKYVVYEDGRYRVSISDNDDNYILIDKKLSEFLLNDLKVVDNFIPSDDRLDRYNQYSDTFRQWLYTIEDRDSIIYIIAEYANSDSNFGRNCSSYNKMMCYLEGKGVDDRIIISADIAWCQYMRECRNI